MSNSNRTKVLLFLLVLLPLNTLTAQTSSIRPELIRSGVDTLYSYLINRSDTVEIGFVIDEISRVPGGDRSTIRRVYISQDQVRGISVDTILDDALTLKPIALRHRSSGNLALFDFGEELVEGWMMLANGDSVAVSTPISNKVYGSSTFDLVLRSSPLEEGWRTEVSAFLASTRTAVPLQARVDGSEDIGGNPAWRIQADFAGTPVTFWVDKASRSLVRQSMRINPDLELLTTAQRRQTPENRQRTL
ncbi:MAG: hypothetical protein LBG44_01000 [Gemmatimonadota bacterium]|nr:hypothetical protein [Gemmatimonadota bacterium]